MILNVNRVYCGRQLVMDRYREEFVRYQDIKKEVIVCIELFYMVRI